MNYDRFYEGGGIYRHVTLTIADPVSILPWGVRAPSVIAPAAEYSIAGGLDEPQNASAAVVSVSVDIANALHENATYTLTTTLLDAAGEMVTRGVQTSVLPAGGWQRVKAPLHFPELPPSQGSTMQLGLCTGGRSQQFKLTNGVITTAGLGGTTLCVTQSPPQRGSVFLTLEPCKPGDPTQGFAYGTPKFPRNIFAASSGKCMDAYGGYSVGVTTKKLDLFGCHANGGGKTAGSAREEFTVDGGTIKAIGFDDDLCFEAVPPSQAGMTVSHRAETAGQPVVQLWNLKRPYLYTVVTTLTATTSSGGLRDSVKTSIGVRSAVFSPDSGFVLNGIPQKIKGLSMHQDFAGCSTAMPDSVNEYRVTELIKMGATGTHCCHEPCPLKTNIIR
eukprot:COSAG01_NODE_6681_length_3546_cov_7.671308_2_plen_388_part_00